MLVDARHRARTVAESFDARDPAELLAIARRVAAVARATSRGGARTKRACASLRSTSPPPSPSSRSRSGSPGARTTCARGSRRRRRTRPARSCSCSRSRRRTCRWRSTACSSSRTRAPKKVDDRARADREQRHRHRRERQRQGDADVDLERAPDDDPAGRARAGMAMLEEHPRDADLDRRVQPAAVARGRVRAVAVERNDFIRDIIDEDLRDRAPHARRDAVPARAERLPPHRARQVDLPRTSGSRATTGHAATCATTTPTRRRKTSSTSSRSSATCAGSASTPTAVLFSADYFPQMYELAERLVARGQGVRLRSRRRADQEYRGTLSEPGRPSPFRDRSVDENLDLLRRMKAGEFPDGACVLRAKIDMASREHEDARSAALPDPPRAPPPHRRRVVHLPDVRLRASARGRDRGHHALDLHARVREQPRALRLGARQHRAVGPAAAPVRVRAARARLHGDEQAQAAHARRGRPRRRLGRSAHADDRRRCAGAATAPRRSARSAT